MDMDRIYILAKDWICDLDIYPTENFGSGSDIISKKSGSSPSLVSYNMWGLI